MYLMIFVHLTDLVVIGLFAELYDLLVPGLSREVSAALVRPPGGYFVALGKN